MGNNDYIFIDNLVECYSDMILRIAIQNIKNKVDAEDIVQSVFLKLLKLNPIFSSKDHEKAWIIRTTINLCKDYLKSAWLRKIIPLSEEIICAGNENNEENILYIVQKLPSNQKNAIYLYYFEEMDIKMIANIMGAKENTVMSWLHRARKKLKIMVEGENYYE